MTGGVTYTQIRHQVLHPGVLFASGLHTVASCARTCRAAHEAAEKAHFCEPRWLVVGLLLARC